MGWDKGSLRKKPKGHTQKQSKKKYLFSTSHQQVMPSGFLGSRAGEAASVLRERCSAVAKTLVCYRHSSSYKHRRQACLCLSTSTDGAAQFLPQPLPAAPACPPQRRCPGATFTQGSPAHGTRTFRASGLKIAQGAPRCFVPRSLEGKGGSGFRSHPKRLARAGCSQTCPCGWGWCP